MPQDNIVKLVWFAAIIFLAVTYGKIIFETVGLFLFFYVFGAFILWIVKIPFKLISDFFNIIKTTLFIMVL